MKDHQPDLNGYMAFIKEDISMYHSRLNPYLLENAFDGFFRVAAANRSITDLYPQQHQDSYPAQAEPASKLIHVENLSSLVQLAQLALLVEPQHVLPPNQAQGQVPSVKRKASESVAEQTSTLGESEYANKKAKRLPFGSLEEDPTVTWARVRRHIKRKPENDFRYTMEWAINQGLIPPKGEVWNRTFRRLRWTSSYDGSPPSGNQSSDGDGVVGLQTFRHGNTFSIPECGPPPVPKKKKKMAASKKKVAPSVPKLPAKLSPRFPRSKQFQHLDKRQTPGTDAKLLERHSLRVLDELRTKRLSKADRETLENVFEYQEDLLEELSEADAVNMADNLASEEDPMEDEYSGGDEEIMADGCASQGLPNTEELSEAAGETSGDAYDPQENPIKEVSCEMHKEVQEDTFEPRTTLAEEAFPKSESIVAKRGVLDYKKTYDTEDCP